MNAFRDRSLTALVVEDQELFREAVAYELSFLGFETVTAKDGEEALRAAAQRPFDLIISDMRMPNKDGKWLLTELRKVQKTFPPFVFMTGFSDLSAEDAFEMGADGVLGKPIIQEQLLSLISKLCAPLESRWRKNLTDSEHKHSIVNSFESIEDSSALDNIILGRGGMFLAIPFRDLRPGDLVSFDITFQSGPLQKLEGKGTVVWKRELEESNGDELGESGYGIDFESLSPASLEGWLNYLKTHDLVPVIPKPRPARPFENQKL